MTVMRKVLQLRAQMFVLYILLFVSWRNSSYIIRIYQPLGCVEPRHTYE